ncbi:unnamed protein product [Sympodiomycopsis kandeliae]
MLLIRFLSHDLMGMLKEQQLRAAANKILDTHLDPRPKPWAAFARLAAVLTEEAQQHGSGPLQVHHLPPLRMPDEPALWIWTTPTFGAGDVVGPQVAEEYAIIMARLTLIDWCISPQDHQDTLRDAVRTI